MRSTNGNNPFLNTASLFKSSQKNRFVSAYLTHQRYAEKEQAEAARQNHSQFASQSPSFTMPKKQSQVMLADPQPPTKDPPDALQATMKRDSFKELPPKLQDSERNYAESSIQQEHEPLLASHTSRKKEESQASRKREELPFVESRTDFIAPQSEPLSEREREIEPSTKIVVRQPSEVRTSQGKGRRSEPKIEDNPYLPSSAKRQPGLTIHETSNGEPVALKKVESNSFHPVSSIPQHTPREELPREELFLTHSSIQRGEEAETEGSHLEGIRKELSGYLAGVRERLCGSYLCLETVEGEYEGLVERALQLECEKLRSALYRLVDEQVSDLREAERREFARSKFLLTADLCEIKCNIDLRLEEAEHHEHRLRGEHWHATVGALVGVDYAQNISFVLNKAEEIQKDLLADISLALNAYAQQIAQELTPRLKTAIRDGFATAYQGMKDGRKGRGILAQRRTVKGEGE